MSCRGAHNANATPRSARQALAPLRRGFKSGIRLRRGNFVHGRDVRATGRRRETGLLLLWEEIGLAGQLLAARFERGPAAALPTGIAGVAGGSQGSVPRRDRRGIAGFCPPDRGAGFAGGCHPPFHKWLSLRPPCGRIGRHPPLKKTPAETGLGRGSAGFLSGKRAGERSVFPVHVDVVHQDA